MLNMLKYNTKEIMKNINKLKIKYNQYKNNMIYIKTENNFFFLIYSLVLIFVCSI